MKAQREVWLFFQREIRMAFRDRTSVINGILVPVFLYPVLMWLIFNAVILVMGGVEKQPLQVAVVGLPPDHREVARRIDRLTRVTRFKEPLSAEQLRKGVNAGEIDAGLVFRGAEPEGRALAGNFALDLIYNQSKDRSARAKDRLLEVVSGYRSEWLEREGRRLGIKSEDWRQNTAETQEAASSKEIGRHVLGMMIPLFLSLMVAIGCFHPAVDAIAGERERGSWETLMSLGASRRSLMAGKYFAVASLGALAGLLNLAAMTLSMNALFAPMIKEVGQKIEFSLPPLAIPVMTIGAVLLALFLGAGMIVAASFARTFKEGQTMVTPVYMLAILPLLFLNAPGIRLNAGLAVVPVVNLLLVFREAVEGTFNWPLIGLVLAEMAVLVFLCLRLAARIIEFEEFQTGSFQGHVIAFLKTKRFFRGTTP